jgi:tetratricopeptide (TPR) repeat protein
MESLKENSVLQTLTKIFNSYVYREKHSNPEIKTLSRKNIIQIFYDYNIIDTCGYNILHLNELLHQLSPDETNEIDLRQFLILIFYIYEVQTKPNFDEESEVNDITIDNINDISDNRRVIAEGNNLIQVMLEDYESGKKIFKFCIPNLKNELLEPILDYETIDQISKYMYAFNEDIFTKYCTMYKDNKNILFINIVKFNAFFLEKHLASIFKGEELMNLVQVFTKFDLKYEGIKADFAAIFDHPMNEIQITDFFENNLVSPRELNFSFSSMLLLMGLLSVNLQSTQDAEKHEKIRFFFEEILNLKRDDAELIEEKITEEKEEDINEETLPESEKLNSVKNKKEYTRNDYEFLSEFFTTLDKVLPPPDENVLAFANNYISPSTKIYTNKSKENPPKFPVEKLYNEVEEERERQIAQKEAIIIAKARKPKKDPKKKDTNPYDTKMGELLKLSDEEERYMGKEKLNILTNRYLKRTFKEIGPNSKVPPTLIKELLMLPKNCPQKCMELIVESLEDKTNGYYETAIKRLEKAQEFLPKDINKINWQTELYFNLSYGSLYENLNYDLMAMKYYFEALHISEKFISANPDNALPFCFLGAFFMKMHELEWSLRAYMKAKQIREYTIGGDTIDTATIYNNLGVISYCMESYLPANGYFQLAYELYKNLLGINHPRTILIKGNITKLNNLNYNKDIQFKSLSLFTTPPQLVKNPKKKK